MSNAIFVAWRSGGNADGHWGPVGKLERIEDGFRFRYTLGAKRLAGFHPFPGMNRLNEVYESRELFPLFANRLLDSSRPEYRSFLEWGGFDPDLPPDPIAVLGVTGGRRETDQLELFPSPMPDGEHCYLTKFFLHGLRWSPESAILRVGKLKPSEWLGLIPDVCNPHDPGAVAVRTQDEGGRYIIGYVPRYLAPDVRKLCLNCDPKLLDCRVERLNPNAPPQFRLLCRLRACWPEGFEPCSDETYQPINEMK